MTNKLYQKSILDLTEFTQQDLFDLLELGIEMKKNPQAFKEILSGKVIGLIFEKASTRTRVSFEAGIAQLGGQSVVLNSKDTQMSRGELLKDTAKVMSAYLDGIMIRTFADQTLTEFVTHGSIPLINGLTDDHHPCQILADFMTIYETQGHFDGLKLVYIGDGNNVAHSLMIGGAIMGLDVTIASPVGYEVKQEYFDLALELARKSGAKIKLERNPRLAVSEADYIYTDVWSSMGQEEEQLEREEVFATDYQVNQELVDLAKADYKFLHCLPAHRGEEVTADIIDGPHSVIYQEAENRLHIQKALLSKLLVP